ncbi:LOW QUALITY PROTEIN: G kinase-anchoring protein 1 [Podargus strigoides]
MASTVNISVPTTPSPFAILQVKNYTSLEPGERGNSQHASKSEVSEERSSGKKNKRAKRRKKKEQQQSEINELRNLAFKKIPQKSSCGGCLSQHEQKLHTAMPKDSQEKNCQEQRQRDEQLTSEMSEADLEKALLLSKQKNKKQKKECDHVENSSLNAKSVENKEKKNKQGKDKPLAVSLKDCQSDSNIDNLAKKHEHVKKIQIVVKKPPRVQLADYSEADNCTPHEHSQESLLKDVKPEQLKLELKKKDAENEQLKKNTQWEAKCEGVKARNAQLLKMMQEREMKDTERLVQLEESQAINNELTSQVAALHAELEKERSKTKLLQEELTNYKVRLS